jgi:hypothetical protein
MNEWMNEYVGHLLKRRTTWTLQQHMAETANTKRLEFRSMINIHKIGSETICDNYRGIILLLTASK